MYFRFLGLMVLGLLSACKTNEAYKVKLEDINSGKRAVLVGDVHRVFEGFGNKYLRHDYTVQLQRIQTLAPGRPITNTPRLWSRKPISVEPGWYVMTEFIHGNKHVLINDAKPFKADPGEVVYLGSYQKVEYFKRSAANSFVSAMLMGEQPLMRDAFDIVDYSDPKRVRTELGVTHPELAKRVVFRPMLRGVVKRSSGNSNVPIVETANVPIRYDSDDHALNKACKDGLFTFLSGTQEEADYLTNEKQPNQNSRYRIFALAEQGDACAFSGKQHYLFKNAATSALKACKEDAHRKNISTECKVFFF